MPKGMPNKKYTGEFKQMVIEAMRNEGLSYRETASRFEINDHHRVVFTVFNKLICDQAGKLIKIETPYTRS